MYDSPKYPVAPHEAEAFVQRQQHGTLIAVAPGSFPEATILPFVKRGDLIELHAVQKDAAVAAARANPRVSFFVSDFLTFSRHDWVDPIDGGRATLNYRAVLYRCEATVTTDPDAVAAALRRLLEAYEPGATYTPIVDGDFYGPRLRMLAALQLRVVETQAKFKVGPAAPADVKLRVAHGLRQRGWPGDGRAADEIETSLHAAAKA